MREIKFRAWDIKKKEMLYNGIEYESRCLGIDDEGIGSNPVNYEHGIMAPTPTEYKRFEIMQFTGLRDSKGVEVFEGDILERYAFLVANYVRSVVTWNVWHWEGINSWRKSKVIGNIFENPDLINEPNP